MRWIDWSQKYKDFAEDEEEETKSRSNDVEAASNTNQPQQHVKEELKTKEEEPDLELDEELEEGEDKTPPLSRRSLPKETKTVTFNTEENYAEQTPLMFSRCSSLESLGSIDQHQINDEGSSVVSEFSRLTSRAVSPSELPDSPGQTMPPSPRKPLAPEELNTAQEKRQSQVPINTSRNIIGSCFYLRFAVESNKSSSNNFRWSRLHANRSNSKWMKLDSLIKWNQKSWTTFGIESRSKKRRSSSGRRNASSMMPPTISVRKELRRSRGPPVRSVSCRSTTSRPSQLLYLSQRRKCPTVARNSATRRKISRPFPFSVPFSIPFSIPFSAELSSRRRRPTFAMHSTMMRFELYFFKC